MSTVLTKQKTAAPSAAELAVLRELARQVAGIAARPIQAERARLCTAHNNLQPGRPLALAFPAGVWRELLPESALRCTHPRAREHERIRTPEVEVDFAASAASAYREVGKHESTCRAKTGPCS